jgi:hypothetical protein
VIEHEGEEPPVTLRSAPSPAPVPEVRDLVVASGAPTGASSPCPCRTVSPGKRTATGPARSGRSWSPWTRRRGWPWSGPPRSTRAGSWNEVAASFEGRFHGPSSRIRRPSSPFEGANLERKPRFTSRKRLYEGRKPRITSFKRPYEGRKPWIRSRNPRFASLKRAYEGRKPGITALEPRIRSLDPRRAGRSNLLGHTSV